MSLLVANVGFGERNDAGVKELILGITTGWCAFLCEVTHTWPRITVPVEIGAKNCKPVPAHEDELVQVLPTGKLGLGDKQKNISHWRDRSSLRCNGLLHH